MFEILRNKGFILDTTKEQKFNKFSTLLKEWNKKFNLTAIKDDEEIEIKHFEDSLEGAKFFPENASVCEIGSGGGFPSIPLMIYREDLKFTLVESVGKKCEFLNFAIKELNLNAKVINKRAEDLGKDSNFRESFNVVTARAVARLNTLSEYTIPLIKKGGLFIAYKSKNDEELNESQNAFKILGAKYIKSYDYSLSNNQGERSVHIVEKLSTTPSIYPRGNGKERSKPL